jgi:hypothetical protein
MKCERLPYVNWMTEVSRTMAKEAQLEGKSSYNKSQDNAKSMMPLASFLSFFPAHGH